MKRQLILFATALGLLAQGAQAQTLKPASPAGSWGFQTENMGYGCALSGDITITATGEKTFKCAFKAVWACQLRLPKSVHTEQSCVATQSGDQVMITSKMEKVAKVQPVEMMEQMKRQYAADHFTVKLNARGDEMDGMFRSYGSAPVKFRKHLELIG